MSGNFDFLQGLSPSLTRQGRQAEEQLVHSPDLSMVVLRRFGEQLAQDVAGRWGEHWSPEDSQFALLKRLEISLPETTAALFHELRRAGNRAAHEGHFSHREALEQLRNARKLAVWFMAEFGDPSFRAPAFVPPSAADPRLHRQLQRVPAAPESPAPRVRGPEVGIYASLQDAFQGLSEPARATLGPLLQQFREAPDDARFRLQPFPEGVDSKLRWLRLDETHALVVMCAPRGDVYLCVWVGPHPEAHAWARHRRFEIHPVLGALQVFDVEQAQAATSAPADVPTAPGLLAGQSDTDLLRCGVPRALLPAVRALQTESGLDELAPHLPAEAGDALYLLAAGASLEETLTELERSRTPTAPVDTEDFAVALEHPDSRRRFRLLAPEASLEEMLQAPLEAWRVYLHPEQRRLVTRRVQGPQRVLGGAGTGKTVALLHRALHLATEVFDGEGERILITTYTRTLAAQLQRQVGVMFRDAGQDPGRVVVAHLHRCALRVLQQAGQAARVLEGAEREQLWKAAMQAETLGLSLAFYQEEWDTVVQPQGIVDRRGYLRARRTGRGTALRREQREAVWAVLGTYHQRLEAGGWLEWPGVIRAARQHLETHPAPFVAVLADEIQDFGEEELRFLRALGPAGPDDLFLVGDTYQRIYGTGTSMVRCGIEIRGRSHRLKVNYRTTERIRDWAVAMLHGVSVADLDESLDALQGYHSLRLGETPAYHLFATAAEEAGAILQTLRGWVQDGEAPEHICVAARTRAVAERLRDHLVQNGMAAILLQEDEEVATPGIRLSTLHRLKGLEFPRVVLAGFHEGLLPLRRRGTPAVDDASAEDAERRERCLVYVAATRARDVLLITGHGRPSPWLTPLPSTDPRGTRP